MDFKIRPIPKDIINKIKKAYKQENPVNIVRFYSYLTTVRKVLVKITVAAKVFKKELQCKQVAVHSINSEKCWIKDIEYMGMGSGFRVGWYAENLTKYKKWYERGWIWANSKYYNPWSTLVNAEYVSRFEEFKYSAYQMFQGHCIINYLKLYKQYPQVEYLTKLSLHYLCFSKQILNKIANDKKFCKWLIKNRTELADGRYYVKTLLEAFKTGKPLIIIQQFESCKKHLESNRKYKEIRELFKGKRLEQFFNYCDSKGCCLDTYSDYLKACIYLKLDMTLNKNSFPHDFKYWHDTRIEQMMVEKEVVDEKRENQFDEIAKKYLALQGCESAEYRIIIARSPAELRHEGIVLSHCVGSYSDRVIKEQSLVFFVRNSDKPNDPFVTIEYDLESKKVMQCYGYKNSIPDQNVIKFVNRKWLPFANETVKQIAA